MAAQKFRQRMHDDVGAVIDRADQIGRGQRVVDDQGHAGLAGDGGDRLDIGDAAGGIGDRLDEDRLGVRRDRAFEACDIIRIRPCHVPAKALECMGELVDRSAIEFSRGDDLVAGHQQLLEHDHLGGVSGRDRKRGGAAFECGDAFFQHRVGRIADAGIDVAEGLQAEQRGGVIGIVEHERRGLIDRRRPRAGGRIRLRARMHGKGRKSRMAIGHSMRPAFGSSKLRGMLIASCVRRQGDRFTYRGLGTDVLRDAMFAKQSFRIALRQSLVGSAFLF